MTKEQEEAIEILEDIKNNTWTTKYIMSSDSKKAETVLNMLKDLQKENKYMHSELDRQQTTINNYAKVIEKKDKIIDLMAEKIDQLGNDYDDFCIDTIWNEDCDEDCKNCIKQYFERKSEE